MHVRPHELAAADVRTCEVSGHLDVEVRKELVDICSIRAVLEGACGKVVDSEKLLQCQEFFMGLCKGFLDARGCPVHRGHCRVPQSPQLMYHT